MAEPSLLTRALEHLERHDLRKPGMTLVWLALLLLRWLVGLHAYSGEHTPPMFGDYEAQRHWMEITMALPVSEWYFNTSVNDLQYWGLDYPPLTAYVSYAFGIGATFVEPDMIALTASRGYETAKSKVYMRGSVILCDLLLLFPAAYWMGRALCSNQNWSRMMGFVIVFLIQPGLVLIDHGHFQYNNVCLGFSLLAVVLLWNDHEFLASVAFCLALNFKQMALYYAPAFGIYLLASCLYRRHWVLHLLKLAIAVVATFAIMWYPFCVSPRDGETCLSSVGQVLHRVFPFARGLFEDKVANIWCVADFVFKLKSWMPSTTQMRLCTVATCVGFLPSIVDLLRRKPTKLRFVLAMANSSLSFFLFSFQVHEKTILLPLLPISLLWMHNKLLSSWFSFLSTFSMYFLLKKDGLIVPYIVLQVLYFFVAVWPHITCETNREHKTVPGYDNEGRPLQITRLYVTVSLLGTIAIHVAQALVDPPGRYPHIFDYLFAVYSCGHFCLALGYCTYWQWTTTDTAAITNQKAKAE